MVDVVVHLLLYHGQLLSLAVQFGGRDRDRAGDQDGVRAFVLESAQRALATLALSSPRGSKQRTRVALTSGHKELVCHAQYQ